MYLRNCLHEEISHLEERKCIFGKLIGVSNSYIEQRRQKVQNSGGPALTLFPMGGGRGVSQSIQTISFQTRIELHGRKLDDNMVSSIPHILEE